MKQRLCETLAWLASFEAQRKYIVHATADNYILPSELFENIYGLMESLTLHPALGSDVTDGEKAVFVSFYRVFERLAPKVPVEDPSVSRTTLVENDASWSEIRKEARVCLDAIGFDLAEWEMKNLFK
jgi:hypothetical protein